LTLSNLLKRCLSFSQSLWTDWGKIAHTIVSEHGRKCALQHIVHELEGCEVGIVDPNRQKKMNQPRLGKLNGILL
jgi:hypothetical protein